MAKQKPKKRQGLKPQLDRIPRKLKDPAIFETETFSWHVHNGYMDYEHPEFGWNKVDILYFLKKIIQALQSYEKDTWQDVRQKRHCHPWGMDDIPKDCAKRLAERQIDIEQLYQISLGNKPRIIGYRDGRIFYLMWWDGEHKFCPTRVR